ncbi:MAG: DUF58 domain-containing protein [Bacteroidetes bacterium]|nr:DUF58 domain-containing protein [Bacteroidota bacterium]MBU1580879.1 DUF58 domain-containing protein [Bacteroidota bacterium]MBU2465270.1 DUF58 domain-containing protein [Bacteroidota bacterium]MBU2558053.1 DUF58 domain-containing protein [Bacteroidota bacterium]
MTYIINHDSVSRYSNLEFLARQVVEGFITGLHKSPFHGFSVEFAEHRLYNPGESIRHIDWKLYGRTEKLFVKRFEEETNLRCQLVIDQSSSMFFPLKNKPDINNPDKYLFSVYAAAALIELMKKQRDAIGLSLFDSNLNQHTDARSNNIHIKRLYNLLEQNVQPENGKLNRQTATASALHQIAERSHKRSLVVIFSDMMDNATAEDELFAALRHLRYNKHEVVLFHVHDADAELSLNYENRPYRFVDMETGKSVKINPVLVQENYREQMSARKKHLMMRCGQYRIDYVDAAINAGYHQVLLPYLLKRSKMY